MIALGAALGWGALAAIGAAALAGRLLGRQRARAVRGGLGLHETVAIVALVLTVAHLSTSAGAMGRTNATGVWFATGGLCAILLQLVLGVTIVKPGPGYRALFITHRVTFGLIAALALAHVVLNGF